MTNFAVLILILFYVAVCTILVGGWMFGTVSKQGESIQKALDDSVDEEFDQGDLL